MKICTHTSQSYDQTNVEFNDKFSLRIILLFHEMMYNLRRDSVAISMVKKIYAAHMDVPLKVSNCNSAYTSVLSPH